MKIRSKLIAAVADFLTADISVPVTIHRETGDLDLEPPYAVVRISTAEPLAPGEPVWILNLLVSVNQNADLIAAEDAEAAAEMTFAPVDFTTRADETNAAAAARLAAFATFCETKGVAISAFEPIDSSLTVSEGNWVHVMGFQAIAAEI
ncbi:hypothetical protein OKA05_02090 [Luteolibacter arcticus]|uniref:Phage tail protein n=1 Tax=Luteolibacter arcticus TaxID=1581411 RepID=A0ABT3GCG7_9BACT|nr:hypothetical protein [Luteolibacter arcticus]MCW1921323.1 hypothetical protein [Luteolibacter arcticus]